MGLTRTNGAASNAAETVMPRGRQARVPVMINVCADAWCEHLCHGDATLTLACACGEAQVRRRGFSTAFKYGVSSFGPMPGRRLEALSEALQATSHAVLSTSRSYAFL